MSYQLTPHEGTVLRLADRAFIPVPSDYPDYEEYLAWLAEGNEPLPADDPS